MHPQFSSYLPLDLLGIFSHVRNFAAGSDTGCVVYIAILTVWHFGGFAVKYKKVG